MNFKNILGSFYLLLIASFTFPVQTSSTVNHVIWTQISHNINLANVNNYFPCDDDRKENLNLMLSVLGLIPEKGNVPNCPIHRNKQMKVIKYDANPLGYRFGCCERDRRTKKQCTKRISPLQNTIFEGTHLKFNQIITLILSFVDDIPVTKAAEYASVTVKSAIDWYVQCREVCAFTLLNAPQNKIGMLGDIVELDEAHLARRKYNRGRILGTEHYWVLGGISRQTRKCFLRYVARRDRETIWPIVEANVEYGSHIRTDDARVYRGIETLGYLSHHVVVHKYYFVDYDDNTNHTNTVERMWRNVKNFVKCFIFDKIEMQLEEFAYKNNYLRADFDPLNASRSRNTFTQGEKLAIFLGHVRQMYRGPALCRPSNSTVTQIRVPMPQNPVPPTVPPVHPFQQLSRESKVILQQALLGNHYNTADNVANFFNGHQSVINNAIDALRNSLPAVYNPSHAIDNAVSNILHPAFLTQYCPIITSGGGDCFYYSISLSIFGTETCMPLVRLATLSIILKYREFFQRICNASLLSYDELLLSVGCTSDLIPAAQMRYNQLQNDFIWADSTAEAATSIAIRKNIAIYKSFANQTHNNSHLNATQLDEIFVADNVNAAANLPCLYQNHILISPVQYNSYIRICHSNNHFVGLLPRMANCHSFIPGRRSDIINVPVDINDS